MALTVLDVPAISDPQKVAMSNLTDLTSRPRGSQGLVELRLRAAARLTGAAATKGSTAGSADALAALHALASSHETAPDALALLHELQVLQVELDLQAQDLYESRAELETALRRQIELYELQPVGSFTIDARLQLVELNLSGAAMLGLSRAEAIGLPLESFLGADSPPRLRAALASLAAGQRVVSCRLALSPRRGPAAQVSAHIGKDATAGRYLVSLASESLDDPQRVAAG